MVQRVHTNVAVTVNPNHKLASITDMMNCIAKYNNAVIKTSTKHVAAVTRTQLKIHFNSARFLLKSEQTILKTSVIQPKYQQ